MALSSRTRPAARLLHFFLPSPPWKPSRAEIYCMLHTVCTLHTQAGEIQLGPMLATTFAVVRPYSTLHAAAGRSVIAPCCMAVVMGQRNGRTSADRNRPVTCTHRHFGAEWAIREGVASRLRLDSSPRMMMLYDLF
jgi:hypothetical protein